MKYKQMISLIRKIFSDYTIEYQHRIHHTFGEMHTLLYRYIGQQIKTIVLNYSEVSFPREITFAAICATLHCYYKQDDTVGHVQIIPFQIWEKININIIKYLDTDLSKIFSPFGKRFYTQFNNGICKLLHGKQVLALYNYD